MKRLLTIRGVLAGLALLGLLLSPLARPVMASQGDLVAHAEIDMADMPCCPDGAAKPDCAKDCPLMALCMAKAFESAPHPTAPVISTLSGHIGLLANDANLHGFAQAPLPRPPDA
jgi:hypothetical protein